MLVFAKNAIYKMAVFRIAAIAENLVQPAITAGVSLF